MTFGYIEMLRSIIQQEGKKTPEKFDPVLRRLQGEVYQAILARLRQCKPEGPFPAPFSILDNTDSLVAGHEYNRVMDDGRRRILVVLSEATAAYGSTPIVTVTGLVNGIVLTEDIECTGDGEFLGDTPFDQVTIGAPVKVEPNTDVTDAAGKIAVFENLGELTDIENRWVAGLFLDERSDRYDQESEPPEMHPWIEESAAALEAFIDRFCLKKQKGRRPTVGLARGFP